MDSSAPPRFLDDHEIYVVELPDDSLPTAPAEEAFNSLVAVFACSAEFFRLLAEISRTTPGIEVQSDGVVFLVKGPRAALDPLVEDGVLSVAGSSGEDTPEQMLGEELCYVLGTAPLTFDGILLQMKELSGWSGINPDWVRVKLDALVKKGWVHHSFEEYVLREEEELDDPDDPPPPRSPRHDELYMEAEKFGEPACTHIRSLIDEIYGDGPLEN